MTRVTIIPEPCAWYFFTHPWHQVGTKAPKTKNPGASSGVSCVVKKRRSVSWRYYGLCDYFYS
jgi:hypothetical protein